MTKRVAVVGSSGGNLFALGDDDPEALISEIKRQADAAGIEVASVQFVAASRSMDSANSEVSASLWSLREEKIDRLHEGTLEEINGLAREMDETLADRIEAREIDGPNFGCASGTFGGVQDCLLQKCLRSGQRFEVLDLSNQVRDSLIS